MEYSYIEKLAAFSNKLNRIIREEYTQHNVNCGLRNTNRNDVIAGLTKISRIKAKDKDANGNDIHCEGQLFYRGIDIRDIAKNLFKDDRISFEETVYLLLFSSLPNREELKRFCDQLSSYRSLPSSFCETIFKTPSKDVMNMLERSVLTLYAYDENPDDTSDVNVLRQCLQLIAKLPLLALYSYQSFQDCSNGESLCFPQPVKELNAAENFLYMLRKGGEYTALESKILNLALVLHADHGGGNNSTFTTRVVTSSGTDTYSAISAALGSLKGPRHGGASIKTVQMFDDMKANINIKDKSAIKDYLVKILDKQAFDKSGLIYGMGHAVYSLSDPRAEIFRKCAKELSNQKAMHDEFELYETVEKIAPEIIVDKRKINNGVSANVDFYSGMIYKMIGIPYELFTPIFAIARIAGWSAHRMEEIQNSCKIIRPTYINVQKHAKYIALDDR